MNKRMTWYMLSQIAILEAVLMLIPFFIGIGYKENTILGFGVTIAALIAAGIPGIIKKPKDSKVGIKEGFIVVSAAWLLLSVFGCLPLWISDKYNTFIDSFFEMVSGFTTTGSSVISEIEALPRSILFWRGFSQWIGGMGVLVLFIAILPKANRKGIVHVFRAESSLPQGNTLMTKLHLTARILYIIYIGLTLLQMILLLFGGMNFFDSLIHSFTTAGTGGFSTKNTSITAFGSVYIEIVITVFMLLYSINFNVLFLLLIGKFRQAARNDEVRWFLTIVFCAIFVLTITLFATKTYETFALSLRHASFNVASTISTTGFTTVDYSAWPIFCQMIIFFLMFLGGCAGSTSGGLKISRVLILSKSAYRDLRKTIEPNTVVHVRMNGKTVDEGVLSGVKGYFISFIIVFVISVMLVSLSESIAGAGGDFTTAVSAVTTSLNNVGPGLGPVVGPSGNFASLSSFTKLVLCFDMLAGRLEMLPMLLIFNPRIWKRS